MAHRYDSWHITEHALLDNHTFAREGFSEVRVLHRYRDGERAEWSAKTQEYLNSKENQGFDRIYSLIAPFVGRTNAPAKIDRA